jgi:predicted amidohydrolase
MVARAGRQGPSGDRATARVSRILHVVGAQVAPVAGDPAATLQAFEGHVRTIRATLPEAQLYLFPELFLTGDHPFHRIVAPEEVAQPVPGPLTERIGRVAASARRWIQAGSIYERVGRRIFNTALLFSPTGALVASYRKLFPWMPFETTTPGSEPPPVHDIPRAGRVGLMICYDIWFPEVARSLALRGAEAILAPTMTSTPDREEELVLARANAIVNQCYVLNVNAAITIGGGRSIGVDPEGRVLFEGGTGEELLSEVLDLDRVRTVRERGTRGLNRLLRQLTEDGPPAAFEAYRDLSRRRRIAR